MVFLSTLQAILGRPVMRSIFTFGARQLSQRVLLEEFVMGIFFEVPFAIVLSFVTIRFAAAGWRPKAFRSDLWTTLIITIVGDLVLEILLPSLQCLPQHSVDQDDPEDVPFLLWWQQTWGFRCPEPMIWGRLLSPDAVGTLLTVRLVFLCLGIYLGESFLPVALTGGIACGKSTVAKMLVDPQKAHLTPSSTGNKKHKRGKSQQYHGNSNNSNSFTATDAASLAPSGTNNSSVGNTLDVEDDGTFLVINADSIAHEILLPREILEGGTFGNARHPVDEDGLPKRFMVSPQDSVYRTILDAFGEPAAQSSNILDEHGCIDRRKLGAVVFPDPIKRGRLNRIMHPRIILILLKRLMQGIYWEYADIVCADVPLLFESGQLRRLFGLTILVACDPDVQFKRLRKRNPELSESECRDRIQSQLPLDQKIHMADLVIWNNGDVEALALQVEAVRRDVMGRVYGVGMSLLQMLLLVGGSLSLAVSSKLFVPAITQSDVES